MGIPGTSLLTVTVCLFFLIGSARFADAQGFPLFIQPEQRRIEVRDPSRLPPTRVPSLLPPVTVRTQKDQPRQQVLLPLDDALRMALESTKVVRVLAGVTSSSSGQTIYDAAITNTTIDDENARFDPEAQMQHVFNHTETPNAAFDPGDPTRAVIFGTRVQSYDPSATLSETNTLGGASKLAVTGDVSRFAPGVFPLNPQGQSNIELSYVQPLLQGGGRGANLAPIVIARIDVERSYFQYKDSVQEMVRGVIDAYWALVFARIDVWTRKQQVEQGQFAFDLASARLRVGLADAAAEAQARVALANFRASLVSSQANLLSAEAALRGMLGAPTGPEETIPVTPPFTERLVIDWDHTIHLAADRRPDLIELKLILEADAQRRLEAANQALPRLDGTALYRWNGLEGVMPVGDHISTRPGQFTDWTLGINFSVPLGLRQSRAGLRRQDLVLARDRANLQEELHTAVQQVAANFRNLDQFYAEYEAFHETREAARTNLEVQLAAFRAGRSIFLDVLQAITDWGNAVSSEAQALSQYNTELANLERQTGTILETHGIRFVEERFASIGPLGRLAAPRPYPAASPPGPNAGRYPTGEGPPERALEQDLPDYRRRRTPPLLEELPAPAAPEPETVPSDAGATNDPPSDRSSSALRLRLSP